MLVKQGNFIPSLAFGWILLCCAGVSPLSVLADSVTSSAVKAPIEQNRSEIGTLLPNNVKPFYLATLTTLYAANNMKLMWQNKEAIDAFQEQLAEIALSGIQPRFAQWVKQLTDPAIKGMARDIVLSDAMLGYLHFVSAVADHGNSWLYGSTPYKMELPPNSVIKQWQLAVHQGELLSYIENLAPQHPQYAKMHETLRTLLLNNHHPWPKLTDTGTLRPGQLSSDVPALRKILQYNGMLTERAASNLADADIPLFSDTTQEAEADDDLSVDEEQLRGTIRAKESAASNGPVAASSRYSSDLVAAVKRFQRWQGLTSDGVVGNRTREWLNVSPKMRASLLALNIQRLRLLPSQIDTGIMVNIPNYSLDYYKDGDKILASRVIVGRPSRKTPLMNNSLNNVVINPPWNVPTKLVREDLLPKAMYNSRYFSQHGYTVLSGWGQGATVINPSSVNWKALSDKNIPYRIQQAPGSRNSLGRFKFNMPNSDAIYLHDTPNHNLFQRDIRALSSGCVRVNKASELAKMLLQNVGWDQNKVSLALKKGDTRYVNIHQHIPVKLYYLTAWIAENGEPQFRTDIYDYDNAIRNGVKISHQAKELL